MTFFGEKDLQFAYLFFELNDSYCSPSRPMKLCSKFGLVFVFTCHLLLLLSRYKRAKGQKTRGSWWIGWSMCKPNSHSPIIVVVNWKSHSSHPPKPDHNFLQQGNFIIFCQCNDRTSNYIHTLRYCIYARAVQIEFPTYNSGASEPVSRELTPKSHTN